MQPTRRDMLLGLGGVGAAAALRQNTGGRPGTPSVTAVARRRIPATGELLPMIGLGTSRTFNVADDGVATLVPVFEAFLAAGGTLIDSSPMYGKAERVVGDLVRRTGRDDLFFATKVWTDEGRDAGVAQMNASIARMRAPVMDLMQIHNLVDWKTHLPTLRDWKERGRIRYIGITEMRDFELVETLVTTEALDFIQIPYSLGDRRVEERVLPAARDHDTAVLVMRPFERGRLFGRFEGVGVPAWAREIGITSWAQLFLKFVLAHPAVTCPIPATSKVHHLRDNMGAGVGPLPDEAMRTRMLELLA
ncbi:MAG: aldo/keto reductase [Phycisphaerales bacterium]|nr:aldo/keto reductase [Phycisphaerales bacterium]NNM24384.1 aldo/keto reductase [Phycisphaerales bacterium]